MPGDRVEAELQQRADPLADLELGQRAVAERAPASSRRCSRSTRRSCPSPRRETPAARPPDRPRRAPRPGAAPRRSSRRTPRRGRSRARARAAARRACGRPRRPSSEARPVDFARLAGWRACRRRALRSISASVRLFAPSSVAYSRAERPELSDRSGSAPACEQHAHHLRVAAMDRGDQRGLARLVGLVDPRAGLDQRLDPFEEAERLASISGVTPRLSAMLGLAPLLARNTSQTMSRRSAAMCSAVRPSVMSRELISVEPGLPSSFSTSAMSFFVDRLEELVAGRIGLRRGGGAERQQCRHRSACEQRAAMSHRSPRTPPRQSCGQDRACADSTLAASALAEHEPGRHVPRVPVSLAACLALALLAGCGSARRAGRRSAARGRGDRRPVRAGRQRGQDRALERLRRQVPDASTSATPIAPTSARSTCSG